MATAKGIKYEDMTATEKRKAEKWATRWGTSPKRCRMTRTGLIITNRNDFPELSDVDYNLIREGIHRSDITDAMREEYIESMKEVPSDREMERVKAAFSVK